MRQNVAGYRQAFSAAMHPVQRLGNSPSDADGRAGGPEADAQQKHPRDHVGDVRRPGRDRAAEQVDEQQHDHDRHGGGAPSAGFAHALLRLADPAEFPAVRAAVLSGSLNDGDDFPRVELRFGLERVLDGLEVLITRLNGRRLIGSRVARRGARCSISGSAPGTVARPPPKGRRAPPSASPGPGVRLVSSLAESRVHSALR
jgi:hypothetical protein